MAKNQAMATLFIGFGEYGDSGNTPPCTGRPAIKSFRDDSLQFFWSRPENSELKETLTVG